MERYDRAWSRTVGDDIQEHGFGGHDVAWEKLALALRRAHALQLAGLGLLGFQVADDVAAMWLSYSLREDPAAAGVRRRRTWLAAMLARADRLSTLLP